MSHILPFRAACASAVAAAFALLTSCSDQHPRATLLKRDRIVFMCQHPMSKAAIPEDLKQHAAAVTVIAPMWYDIHPDGRVALISSDIYFREYLAFCRENNIAVLPLLRNFKPREFLLNPAAIDRAVAEIAALLSAHDFAGVSIDIEEDCADPRTREPMLGFLERVYTGSKRQNRILCVTFNPVYWGRGWQTEAMLSHCDWALAMFYDYSGPWDAENFNATAPYEWPEQHRDVKRDVARIMTPENAPKIIFGIPAYGNRVTLDAKGNCVDFTVAYVNTLLKERAEAGASRQWDERARTPRFEYETPGMRHIVWYEDAESYRWRLALADERRAAGVGVWSIGAEGGLDRDIWSALNQYRRGELTPRSAEMTKKEKSAEIRLNPN